MFDVQVTKERISLEQMIAKDHDVSHGAQITFAGAVRNHNEGKKVQAVSYDAFAPLAMQTFREIGQEALSKWGPGLNIQISHRTGRVELGELSIAIVVSTAHRDAAYAASRYIIEQIKVRSPIWKKEHYVEGDSEWLQGYSLVGLPLHHDEPHII